MIPRVGEEAFAFLKPGGYFGEMSLIDGSPRSAMATAENEVSLLEIRNGDFVQLISEEDKLAKKILWSFCMNFAKRLRETNEKISGFFALTGMGA